MGRTGRTGGKDYDAEDTDSEDNIKYSDVTDPFYFHAQALLSDASIVDKDSSMPCMWTVNFSQVIREERNRLVVEYIRNKTEVPRGQPRKDAAGVLTQPRMRPENKYEGDKAASRVVFAMLEASMDKENRQAVTRRSEHYRLDVLENDEKIEKARADAEVEAKKEMNRTRRKALKDKKEKGGGGAGGLLLDSSDGVPLDDEGAISSRVEAAEALAKAEIRLLKAAKYAVDAEGYPLEKMAILEYENSLPAHQRDLNPAQDTYLNLFLLSGDERGVGRYMLPPRSQYYAAMKVFELLKQNRYDMLMRKKKLERVADVNKSVHTAHVTSSVVPEQASKLTAQKNDAFPGTSGEFSKQGQDSVVSSLDLEKVKQVLRYLVKFHMVQDRSKVRDPSSNGGSRSTVTSEVPSLVTAEPMYSVNIQEIITRLKHKVVADTSASRYGVDGRSLVQLFLSKGDWYEQSTLANLAIIRDRQASTLLYRLFRDDWVEFKDISRRNDFSPQSTTYYWRADRQHIVNKILQQSYKAMSNLRIIRAEIIRTGGLCLNSPKAASGNVDDTIHPGVFGTGLARGDSGGNLRSAGII